LDVSDDDADFEDHGLCANGPTLMWKRRWPMSRARRRMMAVSRRSRWGNRVVRLLTSLGGGQGLMGPYVNAESHQHAVSANDSDMHTESDRPGWSFKRLFRTRSGGRDGNHTGGKSTSEWSTQGFWTSTDTQTPCDHQSGETLGWVVDQGMICKDLRQCDHDIRIAPTNGSGLSVRTRRNFW
jgi:hypothetical protein